MHPQCIQRVHGQPRVSGPLGLGGAGPGPGALAASALALLGARCARVGRTVHVVGHFGGVLVDGFFEPVAGRHHVLRKGEM